MIPILSAATLIYIFAGLMHVNPTIATCSALAIEIAYQLIKQARRRRRSTTKPQPRTTRGRTFGRRAIW